MAVDTRTPRSPGWWFETLMRQLVDDQRPQVERLDRYLRGDHPIPDILETEEDYRAAKNFLKNARANYLNLVVEAVVERMKVTGFRAGPTDTAGDDASQAAWRAAHLDADQSLVYRDMIGRSRGYVMVGRHPRKRGKALVTIEDPRFVTTRAFADDPREVQAALKLWADDENYARATLFYMDGARLRVVKVRSPRPLPTEYGALQSFYTSAALQTWEVVEDKYDSLGVVPIVPFLNRATSDGVVLGEFEDVIDVQNRINQTLLVRLLAEKFGALRQRAILNLQFEEDEETGVLLVPELPNDPGKAWLLGGSTDGEKGNSLSIWESAQTDTSNIMQAVTADIRDLAAITRTPPHYLLNTIVNASGDALKAAETGLISKVKERCLQAGEAWEMVMRVIHRVLGDDERADEDTPLEVIWADPESRSVAELSDAAVKRGTAGLPWRQRMEFLGYTPTEIDRMEADRAQDAMLAGLSASIGAVTAAPADPNATDVVDAEIVEEPEP